MNKADIFGAENIFTNRPGSAFLWRFFFQNSLVAYDSIALYRSITPYSKTACKKNVNVLMFCSNVRNKETSSIDQLRKKNYLTEIFYSFTETFKKDKIKTPVLIKLK